MGSFTVCEIQLVPAWDASMPTRPPVMVPMVITTIDTLILAVTKSTVSPGPTEVARVKEGIAGTGTGTALRQTPTSTRTSTSTSGPPPQQQQVRKSHVEGKSMTVRVEQGVLRI